MKNKIGKLKNDLAIKYDKCDAFYCCKIKILNERIITKKLLKLYLSIK